MTSSPEQAILDAHYMARALELARKGYYTTHPNPRVGCVIVKEGRVIAHYHLGGRSPRACSPRCRRRGPLW